jgi:hypothetical protein
MRLPEREHNILEQALAAFTRATGLHATIVAKEPKAGAGPCADAVIEVEGPGKRLELVAEIKVVDREITLAAAKQQLGAFGKPGVLVTPYLTAELATRCREKLDLQFMDTAGNVYLRAPGLYVCIRGQRPPGGVGRAVGTRGGGTATALRVVFTLLCRPELLNAPYRDIVRAAGVALGAVGWVFVDLHGRGYVLGGQRTRDRRLVDPGRLLDEWVTNYPIKLRPRLNPRRFRVADPRWWQKTRLPEGAFWGGEVAATKLTEYLNPAAYTVYIDPARRREGVGQLVRRHQLRADPEGQLEILDTFWNFPGAENQPDLVPPLLVYADLLGTLDPRNLEIAKRVREEHLNHALRPA